MEEVNEKVRALEERVSTLEANLEAMNEGLAQMFKAHSDGLDLLVRSEGNPEAAVKPGPSQSFYAELLAKLREEDRTCLRYPSRWTVDVVPDKLAGAEYEPVDVEAAAPLVPAFPDAQVSKNFRLSEFRCGDHNYDLIRVSPKLVATLEEIRERAGGHQLHITSGYRPPAYNRKVGGVSNSTHIDGLAADIYSDHLSTDDLYAICDRVIGDKGGVGYYPVQGFVHVDIRGHKARW